MRNDYIPDLTERFPEGFGGVDMTPSFYGEPVDYGYEDEERWGYEDRNYNRICGYEPSYDELVEMGEIKPDSPKQFEIGNSYTEYGFYGGITEFIVEEIDRDNNKILLGEVWYDVDGTGTRPSKWHKLEKDDNGNEKALNWVSKEFGEIWIYA